MSVSGEYRSFGIYKTKRTVILTVSDCFFQSCIEGPALPCDKAFLCYIQSYFDIYHTYLKYTKCIFRMFQFSSLICFMHYCVDFMIFSKYLRFLNCMVFCKEIRQFLFQQTHEDIIIIWEIIFNVWNVFLFKLFCILKQFTYLTHLRFFDFYQNKSLIFKRLYVIIG